MRRQFLDDYTGPYAYGIDVSAWQGKVAWPSVARSSLQLHEHDFGPPQFAVVRASDGVRTRRNSIPDPTAVRNLVGAAEAGLLVGVYHYVRAYHPAEQQVEVVLDVLRTAGVDVGFVALDIEGRPDNASTPEDESDGTWWAPESTQKPVSTGRVIDVMAKMTGAFRGEGHRTIVYTGVAWHWYVAQHKVSMPEELADLELWTPYYTKSTRPKMPVGPKGEPWPWSEWRMWQFAGSKGLPGRVNGIEGPVDLNRFRGTVAEMEQWWGAGTWERVDWDRDEISILAERAQAAGDLRAYEELCEAMFSLKYC